MKKRSKKAGGSRRGPKGDPGQARESILAAARSEFGSRGFEATTMRGVAAAAGVDVALVPYYFGTKAELFVAALALPVDPAAEVRAVLGEGRDGAGERVLRTLLSVWDEPATGSPLVALMRSLSTQSEALRHFIEGQMLAAVAESIDAPDAELRAAAFTSQVLGLVLERYVLGVEPLASADHDQLLELIGPTLQRYLDG